MGVIGGSPARSIGPLGTTARILIGTLLLVFGALIVEHLHGQWHFGINLPAVFLGLLALPAILMAWQWLRLRRDSSRFEATGPFATVLNIGAFAILIGISFVPVVSYIGFAAFVFYGASMLLAAVRGYSGCEVLAVSNWLLRRDDQIGCLVLSPIDNLERQLEARRPSAP